MTFETKISVEQEYRDPRYKNCQRFFNNLKKVSEKDLYKSYGLFIDNDAFHLVWSKSPRLKVRNRPQQNCINTSQTQSTSPTTSPPPPADSPPPSDSHRQLQNSFFRNHR